MNTDKKRVTKRKRKPTTIVSSTKQKLMQISRGLKSSPEIKGLIIQWSGTMVTTGTVRDISSSITQGLTSQDRLGNVITAKGLQWKGTITHNATSSTPVSFRVIFFVCKNPNGTTILPGRVLSPTDNCGMLPLASMQDFIILRDYNLSSVPPIIWNGVAVATFGDKVNIEGYIKLKDLPITYIGTSGLPSSAGMNSISFLVIADNGAVLDYCITSKLTYTDA